MGTTHIIFGIILISAKKKEKADFILMSWLLILLGPFIEELTIPFLPPHSLFIRFINPAFSLLNGPFLYLYMEELTRNKKVTLRTGFHFFPFALIYFLLILFPAPLHPGGPMAPLNDNFSLFRYFGKISLLNFGIYAFFSLKSLRKHRQKTKETYAYQSGEITLLWLTLLPLIFIGLLTIIILFEKLILETGIRAESLHLSVFLLLALYLIFFGLKQREIFPGKQKSKITSSSSREMGVKKTKEKEESSNLLLNKLKDIMEEKKLYLNPTLSVYNLAQETKISRHQISSLLNETLSINFFQFVNGYRLEEVSRRLKEDRENKFNILEHAFDAGFNSKSSFNSLFKSKFGQTPSQYRKSLQSSTNI
jgi:AraC-like DNA-binding protein